MGETIGLNRKVAQIWTNVGTINSNAELMASALLLETGNDRIKIRAIDDYKFVASAYSTNASNDVILSPTSTTVQIVVKAYNIDTSSSTGTIDLESSSTGIGVGGVFHRMFVTKNQMAHANRVSIPLGIGADLRVTSTAAADAFVGVNYIETT